LNANDKINEILAELGWAHADCEIGETPYGATNLSYFCAYRNEKYIIRIGAANSDLLVINRNAELAAMEAARGADYSIPLIHFNPENGNMVTKYVDADPMTWEEFSGEENIIRMAAILKDLHSRKTAHFFNPYEDVEKKLGYIKRHNIPMHEKFDEAYAIYGVKRDRNPAFEDRYLGLCHNDITTGNCLITKDKQRIYLIDYEFSGMGNIYNDILCTVHGFPPEKQQLFLTEYFGGYEPYMTQKIKDFHVIVLMWNVTWAYLKTLDMHKSPDVDYMLHGNQWVEAILGM